MKLFESKRTCASETLQQSSSSALGGVHQIFEIGECYANRIEETWYSFRFKADGAFQAFFGPDCSGYLTTEVSLTLHPPDDADSGTGEYPCVDLRYGNGSGASGLKTTVSAQVVSLDVRQNEVSLQDFGFVLVDLRNCTSCSFPRPTFFTLVPKNQCLAAPRGTGNEPGVSGSDPGTEARVIYSEVSAAKYSVLRYGNPRCSGAPTAVTHYAYGSCDQDREALASRFAVESPGAASALADYWERFGAEVSDVPLGLGIGVGGDAVGATAGAAKKMETARGGGASWTARRREGAFGGRALGGLFSSPSRAAPCPSSCLVGFRGI